MRYFLWSEQEDNGEVHYYAVNERGAAREILEDFPDVSYEEALKIFKDKYWAKDVEIDEEDGEGSVAE